MARLPEGRDKEDSGDKNTDGATVSIYPGAVQQGLVNNRHSVLEFSSFSALGGPPFHLNGSIRLQRAAIKAAALFLLPRQIGIGAIILLGFCDGYLALALPLQVHHTHVHDGTQIGEGLHHSHI